MLGAGTDKALSPCRAGRPCRQVRPVRPGHCAWFRAAKWYPAVAGSGDKQASAKLCRLEIDEVAVAFSPPTGCEVITEAVHCPLLGVRPDSGPDRYSAADMIVEVCLGSAPVGLEEAVSAVPRNEHRFHPGSDRAGHLGQRRPADAKVSDLGQVVASQPEPIRVTGVEREHHLEREHHHAASDAPHLAAFVWLPLPDPGRYTWIVAGQEPCL